MHHTLFVRFFLCEVGQQKEVGNIIEGLRRKEVKDGRKQECLIVREYAGLEGGGGRGGVGLPSILSGCGSPLWTSPHRHPS